MLVVTGAAAAGKSTVGAALAGRPGLLVLDGDVLAAGAASMAGRRDYTGFWSYLLSIAAEVHRNGLTPVFSCICLPEQVIGPAGGRPVHFLALVSDAGTVRRRITDRAGGRPEIDLDFHAGFDRRLRECAVVLPHTFRLLDTAALTVEATVAAAHDWVADVGAGVRCEEAD